MAYRTAGQITEFAVRINLPSLEAQFVVVAPSRE
jgi:hypothetical protein